MTHLIQYVRNEFRAYIRAFRVHRTSTRLLRANVRDALEAANRK